MKQEAASYSKFLFSKRSTPSFSCTGYSHNAARQGKVRGHEVKWSGTRTCAEKRSHGTPLILLAGVHITHHLSAYCPRMETSNNFPIERDSVTTVFQASTVSSYLCPPSLENLAVTFHATLPCKEKIPPPLAQTVNTHISTRYQ